MDYFCSSWIQDQDLPLWERAYQVLLKEADFYQVMFPEGEDIDQKVFPLAKELIDRPGVEISKIDFFPTGSWIYYKGFLDQEVEDLLLKSLRSGPVFHIVFLKEDRKIAEENDYTDFLLFDEDIKRKMLEVFPALETYIDQ